MTVCTNSRDRRRGTGRKEKGEMRSEGERSLEWDTDGRKQKDYRYRSTLIFTQAQKIPQSQIAERCHTPSWLASLLLWQPKQGFDQGKFQGNHSDCLADRNDIAAL